MATREVTIDHRRIFLRVAVPVFLVRQLLVLNFVPPRRRVAFLLFGRGTTRKSLILALSSGATLTLSGHLDKTSRFWGSWVADRHRTSAGS